MTKYVYFFRGDLNTHVGLYKNWSDLAGSLNMKLFTIIGLTTFLRQKKAYHTYIRQGITIKIVPNSLQNLFIIIYFGVGCLLGHNYVIHLRKRSPLPFRVIRMIFKSRIKYFIELEGDYLSEIDYLKSSKNNYKQGFYDSIIKSMYQNGIKLDKELVRANGIFAVSDELKKLYVERLNIPKNKITVIPTGYHVDKFYVDNSLREETRSVLGINNCTVCLYSGNIFYSWQNLKRTIEVFKLLQDLNFEKKLFLLLLIRKKDLPIAREFIRKSKLLSSQYLLKNVAHEEMNAYLNAADIGILLRDNHTMNIVSSPGKVGEYLACGLNVIISDYIGNYSKLLKKHSVGNVINNIELDQEFKAINITVHHHNQRKIISDFSKHNFSVNAYKDVYLNALTSFQ